MDFTHKKDCIWCSKLKISDSFRETEEPCCHIMNNICKNKTKKLAKNINIQHFFLLEMNKVN